MITQFTESILFNLNFNLAITILCAGSYLFNLVILRLRKAYLPLNTKYAIVFSILPCLNLTFLAMNCIIGCMNIGCYTVKKKRATKSTYNYYKNRIARKSA